MVGLSRYSVGDTEADDARNGFLKNNIGSTDAEELGRAETVLLADAYEHFFLLSRNQKLEPNTDLIFSIHKYFLGTLYSWAGKLRTVNISKGNTMFASAEHLQVTLQDFDRVLKDHLPNRNHTKKGVAHHLAIIHCEFNAIHPFREGNGRTIRLFLDLLALQAGYEAIHWGKSTQKRYMTACVEGMKAEYGTMEKVIYAGLVKIRS